ncbi:hypothetical protein CR513_50954, partial [Mucuna pruriens]
MNFSNGNFIFLRTTPFDETWPSWKKGSHIFKIATSKIRNSHDRAIWISPRVRIILAEHWGSMDFQNKSFIVKANRAIDKGASTYCGESISTSTHYEKMSNLTFNCVLIVGGKNAKGNVYGLGKLTSKFMHSTRILTNLIEMPMVEQMEEMRETIHKLNNELLEKKANEKSLVD